MEANARGVLANAADSRLPHRILGIDLALRNVGLVVFTEEGHVLRRKTLVYTLRRRTDADAPIEEADHIERLLNIANEIVGWAKVFNVKEVGIEGFAYDMKWQAHQLGQAAGVVKTQLWLACRVVSKEVPMSAARKHFLGYGRPQKEQIVEVMKLLGLNVATDHEADAYVVARYLFDYLTGTVKKSATSKKTRRQRKRKQPDKQGTLDLE